MQTHKKHKKKNNTAILIATFFIMGASANHFDPKSPVEGSTPYNPEI